MKRLIHEKAGKDVFFVSAGGGLDVMNRLTDMGLIPGEKIRVLNNSGHGPVSVLIKGSKVALGHGLAKKIIVDDQKQEKKILTIALAGNPNSGKSTIFNNLTGAHQHVGNYPGVTVEKREGQLNYRNYEINIVDLPGTYSLSAYSDDEVVARNFIINSKPDIIIHIVNVSNLERNLYLYTQLADLEVPLVLAMNMSDIAAKKGQQIDYEELSRLLGKPIVPTIGNKKKGMDDLLDAVIKLNEGAIPIEKVKIDYGEEIHSELTIIEELLAQNENDFKRYPAGWLGIKLLENDPLAIDIVKRSSDPQEILSQNEKSRHHLKQHFSDDPEIIIADRRYGFISGACTQAMRYSVEERHDLSDKIDRIVLNRVFGLPIFAMVMYSIFKFTFSFSKPVIHWVENIFEWLQMFVSSVIPAGLFQSFFVDGIIGGVGGVLGFFPLVLFMFFAIAFFEDSGYMARAAFVMDRVMSKFGLHGKSFLPMMIATNGCAVPGILATRTLDNKKDRLITMMVTPFMICGAKLPIFALFIGAFFPADYGANIMFVMYGLSILLALGSAWILKKFVLKSEVTHFVMELPPYRVPTIQGLLLKMWERGWLYVKKAGTIILLISIIIWAGFTFPESKVAQNQETYDPPSALSQLKNSYAGRLGQAIEPAVKPLGLDWRAGIALVSGVAAKEVVVSTLGTLYSLEELDVEVPDSLKAAISRDPFWNPLKAFAFLMFCLIYLPCLATVAVFYVESGSSIKWTTFLIFWTTAFAWGAAFIVYRGGLLIGLGG